MAPFKMTWSVLFLILNVVLYVNAQRAVAELHEDNWHKILEDEWMVEFYAPWCPACKGLQPIWKEFALMGSELGVKVGQVDVTVSPGLSGRFMVTALPTIFHVLNGEFRQYKGTRDKVSFVSFIEEKKWKTVDPISRWKSPSSIQMSLVSSFFKLSQLLRGIHTHLMEEFGLPTWGSYLIFAVATIVLGALLGLVLVCIIDLVYPPKSIPVHKTPVESKEKSADKLSDDELADEDIKDDLLDDAEEVVHESDSESGDRSRSSSPTVKKRKPRKAD
ncbi:hypothetical protein PPYR_14394 [Photinus pyralis]|uniref:Thioredoxin domain-containing protein n=1 Tax=Photinus pyralis TaxID=7054 RepID=A0A5N4A535_PHOPY|nr:thioredoxin-related transmembrane protein 1-like isoform X2 [Photinus pyralis]KAB0792435.1 hypothetical protein PPYR_14394 [Photinus pyralis]